MRFSQNLTLFRLSHNATKCWICMVLKATFFPFVPFYLLSCEDTDCIYTVLWCTVPFQPITTMSSAKSKVELCKTLHTKSGVFRR